MKTLYIITASQQSPGNDGLHQYRHHSDFVIIILSVCPLHADIVSKRLNVSSTFVHSLIAMSFLFSQSLYESRTGRVKWRWNSSFSYRN